MLNDDQNPVTRITADTIAPPAKGFEFGAPSPGAPSPAGLSGFGNAVAQNTQVPAANPFDMYTPSQLSPARREYEDSTMFKIGSVLSSFGESVPTNLKIKLAQQDADLKLAEHRMAVSNFYKSNEVARQLMQDHNRKAQQTFLEVMPNMQAQITFMYGAPKEEQDQYVEHLKKMAESLHPGGGEMIDFFYKNQSSVYASNALLSSRDPEVAKQAQSAMNTMGADKWQKTPEIMALANTVNTDYLTSSVLRVPMPLQTKLATKSLPETEFRQAVKEAGYQQGMRPIEVTAMLAHLDTPNGQGQMHEMGVVLNSLEIAKEKKLKELTPQQAGQQKEYQYLQDTLSDAKTAPGKYTDSYLREVRSKIDIYNGLQAKPTSPGENPNNAFNRALDIKTRGKVKSVEDIASLPKADQDKYYAIADQVQTEVAERSPLAGNTAKLEMLHDTHAKPVYKLGPKGDLQLVKGTVTQREYLTGGNLFTMSSAQADTFAQLESAEAGGKQLFAAAEKAYTAKDKTGRAAELLAEWQIGFSKATGAIAAETHPDLFNYVSERSSRLGTYARSLGGERGVLTDQDIARVEKMFATSADSARTRKAKEAAFNKLITLNRSALMSVLVNKKGADADGEVTADELQGLKLKYKDTVNGILGSVEGLAKEDAAASTPSGKSLAEPSSKETGRGESLLERMRKGK